MTEQLRPENRGIRLVEANEVLTVTRDREGEVAFFVTEPKHPPETQDLFLTLRLTGSRFFGISTFVPPRRGLSIMDGSLVTDNMVLAQHEDLCYIDIEAEPGFVWPGKEVYCEMHIDGIETYYTSFMGYWDTRASGREQPFSCADEWLSSDPSDPNVYCLMVAPQDTALLSRLSFSFSVVSADATI